MKIQVTYFCETNKYMPISTTIEVPSSYHFIKNREYWRQRALLRILAKRYWTIDDLQKFGYTICKERVLKDESH